MKYFAVILAILLIGTIAFAEEGQVNDDIYGQNDYDQVYDYGQDIYNGSTIDPLIMPPQDYDPNQTQIPNEPRGNGANGSGGTRQGVDSVATTIINETKNFEEIKELREALREEFVAAVNDFNVELKNQVRAARGAIARVVSEAIKSSPEIDFDDIKGLEQEIRIEAGKIMADSSNSIDASKTIKATIRNRVIEIRNGEGKIQLFDSTLPAEATPIEVPSSVTISDSGLKINDRPVRLIPSEIKEKINATQKVSVKLNNGAPKYEAELQNNRNLFGFINIKTTEKAVIDAETGKIDSYERPWWSFLTTGNDAVSQDQTIE